MADGGDGVSARVAASLGEVDRAQWDGIANPDPATFNPFVSFAFLSALETSGSVGPGSGWTPAPLLVERDGRLVGAAPLYVKTHSLGEYVFDQGWAEAYERAGGRYYPKLVVAAPFTPVAGPRLLAGDERARHALAEALSGACEGFSSVHVNFVGVEDEAALLGAGFLPRTSLQYHWLNRGYRDFPDFLDALSSRKRKAIRREREAAQASGLAIRRVQGNEVKESHWDAMWAFYQDTGARKWGRPYLTRAFFSLIGDMMAGRIALIFAERDGAPVAGAMHVIGGDALFGRYWGCLEPSPFLHFELCYYQAIEIAIERGLNRVEAGAQGEHKIARGYEPAITRSAHWIADPALRQPVARFLAREREAVEHERTALLQSSPYKQGNPER